MSNLQSYSVDFAYRCLYFLIDEKATLLIGQFKINETYFY